MTHVHLIGIGGTGLSAIAAVLVEKGYSVSGSDRALSPLAQNLRAAGVTVHVGHRAENIAGADLVVRSSAVSDNNPEVQAAREHGIPVLKRADFLAELTGGKTVVAIAGTHGKTTTTAMTAWMLHRMGQDPSFISGGVLQNLGKNAHAGSGAAFVIEADEYDYMFLGLNPAVIALTIVEHDHPDCFPTPADYRQAFVDFTARLNPGGTLIACADDPGSVEIAGLAKAAGKQVTTYAIDRPADLRARDLAVNPDGGFSFTVVRAGEPVASIQLKVPGLHNVRNALAALAAAGALGLALETAAGALSEFSGAGRRFEIRGEVAGITLVDDYAHHPTEIRATLAAARSRYPDHRIWAVWQPHTYSRTQALFEAFAASFADADQVIVTEVYAAREQSTGFSAAQLAAAMQHKAARFIATLPDVVDTLASELRAGDVVLVCSAGDADQITTQCLTRLKERGTSHG